MTNFDHMSITVEVDAEHLIQDVVWWVHQFELVAALGEWNARGQWGEVQFGFEDVAQGQRLVGYIAAWEGETCSWCDCEGPRGVGR